MSINAKLFSPLFYPNEIQKHVRTWLVDYDLWMHLRTYVCETTSMTEQDC